MLIKTGGRETHRHFCRNMTKKHADNTQELKVYLHDVQAYITYGSETATYYIQFCPYCGVKIEEDQREEIQK